LRFSLKEKAGKGALIEAHQTFVKFTAAESGREIVFLAQANSNKQYSAEIVRSLFFFIFFLFSFNSLLFYEKVKNHSFFFVVVVDAN
jgi:hypothetical protein